MKIRTERVKSVQYLIFEPEDDGDIFLLGKIAVKVTRCKVEFIRDDSPLKLTQFKIRSNELMILLEKSLRGD